MPHDQALSAIVDDRADAALAFLAAIVDMDSPTEDKAATDRVGAVLAQAAERAGLAVTREAQADFGDTLVARGGAGPGPRVLMVGHYDTVYAAGTVATRPFTRTGALATGPGALDMKGGLTIGLLALEALGERFGTLPLPVTFVFNADEEIGSPASRARIEAEARAHDLALILEPGRPGPALTIARKGVGIFHLDVAGIEAHAGAEPEKGANAIVALAAKTLAIAALADPAAGTTVTPGVVAGGTKPYVVPGAARLSIDARVPSVAEQARIERALAEITARTDAERTTARLAGRFHRPPMEASPEALRYVAIFRRAAEDAGFPLGTAATGGASDGNLTAAAGCPTIDGLGVHGGRAHSAEEFIEVASLAGKARALAAFLATIAGR